MSNSNQDQTITIEINPDKITKLTQLCQQKGLTLNRFIDDLIDNYLNDYDNNITNKQSSISEQSVNSLISQAILPLTQRIDKLEAIIANNDNKKTRAEKKEHKAVIEEANRKYLPRHDVWQILKKTEYINYSGYDHFLNADPNEFENYGIFFDTEKKRYYLIKDC